ncbi:thiamine-phosphate kinase [Paenibacillus sp. HB172176]|uniref:thiamine-phosphate kinase n=1 Tax=Paenibacillus sp. HB172176 TaxID=2493690 RepID=UPI00143C6A80|nr:thiamine-phosphate kinase [Paenibacillus sp. HB172176]
MDEFKRIRYWTEGGRTPEREEELGVIVGIGDDAAIVDWRRASAEWSGGQRLIMTVDTMVETVHFNEKTMRDEDVGYKALAACVSDIAAMGGRPLHALVAVSQPPSYSPERMRRVYDGLHDCAKRYGIAIVGGDTTASPQHMVISVTLTGCVEEGGELLRSGAKAGDAIFVTGEAGMSAAGLQLLQEGLRGKKSNEDLMASYEELVAAHRRPKPSLKAAELLRALACCHALNDVSDGLASEAWEIAEASGVRMIVREGMLPINEDVSRYASASNVDPLEWILYGGEDYMLIGTMAASKLEEARLLFLAEGVPFYCIGFVEEGEPSVELLREDVEGDGQLSVQAPQFAEVSIADLGTIQLKRGYNHFER